MNAFQQAISDIFKDENFLESFTYNDVTVPCVCSPIIDGLVYSEAGLEKEADFTLDVQLPLSIELKVNDKLTFRGKTYKISLLTTDSANTSLKIHLLDLSQR